MKYNFIGFIPDNVKSIIIKLIRNDEESYVVGGACRDFMLGKQPKDFDVVTSASANKVKEVFPKAVTGGNAFLVNFVDSIEVATFRKDRSDYAEIAKSLKEDVIRRDFTMNAIAYDMVREQFIDYVGGIHDIENRILRFVGDPEKRILEDPVRILRGIRFASKYNLSIEKETYFEMFRFRHLLKDIPKERILLEVTKAFQTNNTHRFLTLLEEMEMLQYVFPSLVVLRSIDGGGYHNEVVLSHCFNAVKAIEDKDWKLKLAALYHDSGKQHPVINDKGFNTFKDHNVKGMDYIVKDLKEHLKCPNDLVSYVKYLCLLHMEHLALESERNIKRFYSRLLEKEIPLKDFILLRYADSRSNASKRANFRYAQSLYKKILKVVNKKPPFSIKDLDIDGKDIMALLNIPPSRLIGEILRNVFDKVQEDLIPNEKNAIIEYVQENYKR